MENRCETCRHFVTWPKKFNYTPAGICTAPTPEFVPFTVQRTREFWDGRKCQVWTEKDRANV